MLGGLQGRRPLAAEVGIISASTIDVDGDSAPDKKLEAACRLPTIDKKREKTEHAMESPCRAVPAATVSILSKIQFIVQKSHRNSYY